MSIRETVREYWSLADIALDLVSAVVAMLAAIYLGVMGLVFVETYTETFLYLGAGGGLLSLARRVLFRETEMERYLAIKRRERNAQ